MPSSASLLRYWHTVRHLKPVQVYGRVLFRLARPVPDLAPAPPVRACTGPWVHPPARAASLLSPTRVRLLNLERDIATPADWRASGMPRLWLYNLHYFDDLAAPADAARAAWQQAFVQRWIRENPPAAGPGWEPYPTSLRIVNWVKWLHDGAEPRDDVTQSLAVQARWLTQRIEHHLLANHLFVNAKALVIAGLHFDGPEAAAWRARGLQIIARELPEQLHADGGHFEASPMYHALMLEDLLDLCNMAATAPAVIADATVAQWREAATRMASWLRAMTHPDGEISFFNDAAIGVAPPPAALQAYADALGLLQRDVPLSDSGYVRLSRSAAVLLADIAPVGPDYQPGHAHADTLSFELSLGTQRVIVNSGTSTYDVGAQRNAERGTAAHSTVTINDADSSEVWGGFRVARRARATRHEVREAGDVSTLRGTHDGYRTQPGAPVHEREWQLRDRSLRVVDHCTGARHAVARFFLHPDVTPTEPGVLLLPDGTCVQWTVHGGDAVLRPSEWAPSFNTRIPSHCLEVTLAGADLAVEFTW